MPNLPNPEPIPWPFNPAEAIKAIQEKASYLFAALQPTGDRQPSPQSLAGADREEDQ